MTLGVVIDGNVSCCLCKWDRPGDEKSLRRHLELAHWRMMVCTEERQKGGKVSLLLTGPRWKNDLA